MKRVFIKTFAYGRRNGDDMAALKRAGDGIVHGVDIPSHNQVDEYEFDAMTYIKNVVPDVVKHKGRVMRYQERYQNKVEYVKSVTKLLRGYVEKGHEVVFGITPDHEYFLVDALFNSDAEYLDEVKLISPTPQTYRIFEDKRYLYAIAQTIGINKFFFPIHTNSLPAWVKNASKIGTAGFEIDNKADLDYYRTHPKFIVQPIIPNLYMADVHFSPDGEFIGMYCFEAIDKDPFTLQSIMDRKEMGWITEQIFEVLSKIQWQYNLTYTHPISLDFTLLNSSKTIQTLDINPRINGITSMLGAITGKNYYSLLYGTGKYDHGENLGDDIFLRADYKVTKRIICGGT